MLLFLWQHLPPVILVFCCCLQNVHTHTLRDRHIIHICMYVGEARFLLGFHSRRWRRFVSCHICVRPFCFCCCNWRCRQLPFICFIFAVFNFNFSFRMKGWPQLSRKCAFVLVLVRILEKRLVSEMAKWDHLWATLVELYWVKGLIWAPLLRIYVCRFSKSNCLWFWYKW